MLRFHLATVLLLAASGLAQAQTTVYRCGNAFSQAPCEYGSQAIRLNDTSAPSRAEAQAARQQMLRDHHAAESLSQARQKDEASQRFTLVLKPDSPAKTGKTASASAEAETRDTDRPIPVRARAAASSGLFKAVGPRPEKQRSKH